MTEWLKSAVGSLLVAWERRESGVAYDLLSPQLKQDPYPIYRELRSKDPVHRMRLVKAWALTRYRTWRRCCGTTSGSAAATGSW